MFIYKGRLDRAIIATDEMSSCDSFRERSRSITIIIYTSLLDNRICTGAILALNQFPFDPKLTAFLCVPHTTTISIERLFPSRESRTQRNCRALLSPQPCTIGYLARSYLLEYGTIRSVFIPSLVCVATASG